MLHPLNTLLYVVYTLQFQFRKFFCLTGYSFNVLFSGLNPVLKLQKHLQGVGARFSRKRKGGMIIINREIVYAKMFYGEWCCFSHPASTRVLVEPTCYKRVISNLRCLHKQYDVSFYLP